MITPTVGRIVYFWPYPPYSPQPNVPLAAIVTRVWSESSVTVCIFTPEGYLFNPPPAVVRLLQPTESPPSDEPYCTWPPAALHQAAPAPAPYTRMVPAADMLAHHPTAERGAVTEDDGDADLPPPAEPEPEDDEPEEPWKPEPEEVPDPEPEPEAKKPAPKPKRAPGRPKKGK